MSPRHVHLVGSVPMQTSREVFEVMSGALGTRLPRIPDGEIGERRDWITWLEPVFANHPAFQLTDEVFRVHQGAAPLRRYELKKGVDPADVSFGNLFYADIARDSYETFRQLRVDGKIPKDTRFQVCLAPAHSLLWVFTVDRLHGLLDQAYNDALRREIEKLSSAVPHADLAIQFDVASAVFARLERGETGAYGTTKQQMQKRFTDILRNLANSVPADVELLFHFCYGDSNHKHVVEPTDMRDMVEVANLLSSSIARIIQLIHMPVPRDRSDENYFAPLKDLHLGQETELCLGLVHFTDGVIGSKQRLSTASKFVRDFSVATECGWGRRSPETIPELLRIHAAVSET